MPGAAQGESGRLLSVDCLALRAKRLALEVLRGRVSDF
jgi:hypothetical protein